MPASFRSLLPKKLHHRRTRKEQISPASALESLETRILPAVDLVISEAYVTIKGDPPAGSNSFLLNLGFTVKNLGTTPVEVNGVAGDLSDNVKVRIYGSLDTTLDAGDHQVVFPDTPVGIDNGSKVLNQNDETGIGSGLTLNASQSFNYFIFFVDFDNKIVESNGNNNTFAVDVSKIEILGGSGTVNAPKKVATPLDTDLKIRDLNTLDFNGGNFGVTVDGAQFKDKLSITKSGTGADKLRIAGTHLKLGAQTVGNVKKVIPTSGNNFQQALQIEFTGSISRDQLTRLLHNVSLKPAKTSSGTRQVHFQVKDNLENLSNVIDRDIAIQ